MNADGRRKLRRRRRGRRRNGWMKKGRGRGFRGGWVMEVNGER